MKFKELVEDTILEEKSSDDPSQILRVKDKVFLDSLDFINSLVDIPKNFYATDYAVLNGVFLRENNSGYKNKQEIGNYPLRNFSGSGYPGAFYRDRWISVLPYCHNLGICPSMHIKLDAIISAKTPVKFGEVKNARGDVLYHTLELGAFPKNCVGNEFDIFLTKNWSSMKKTGKTYSGYFNENNDKLLEYQEYEFRGEKYVCVRAVVCNITNNLNDGSTAPSTGKYRWVKVEPITWQIRNWDDLPITINPNGSGNAKFIDVRSEEAILPAMPFFTEDVEHNSFWQNTYIRAYLNGYDIHAELRRGNGNAKFALNTNYVFKRGFLDEAFEDKSYLQGSYSNYEEAQKDEDWKGNYLDLE